MKIDLVKIYKELFYTRKYHVEQDESVKQIETILHQFRALNDEYKYFPEDDENIMELYVNCYKTFNHFVQNSLSKQLQFTNSASYKYGNIQSYVYKMVFLFSPSEELSTESTLKNFQKYCNKFLGTPEGIRYHLDDGYFAEIHFPKNSNYGEFKYNVEDMQQALTDIGPKVLKNLYQINDRQKACGGSLPKEKKLFETKLLEVSYPTMTDNVFLATLCAKYNIPDPSFRGMINLMKSGILPSMQTAQGLQLMTKSLDNLPDVHIEYLNEETGTKYYLVKLPSDDLRAIMLGAITGNCQTILGGDADAFIIDGITRPNNGFYVLIKQDKNKAFNSQNIDWDGLEKNGHEIVGQSYAWIDRDKKSITLEAPQVIKDRCPNIEITKIFDSFGQALEEQGYDRLTIGQHLMGLGGCKNFVTEAENYTNPTYRQTAFHSIPQEGQRYHFTTYSQYEVYSSERLDEIRMIFVELTKFLSNSYNPERIVSIEQGEALIELIDKSKDLKERDSICKYLSFPYLTTNWSQENLSVLLQKFQDLEDNDQEKYKLISSAVSQDWFNLGMTIEDIIDTPLGIIKLLYSNIKYHSSSIWSVIPFDELMKNIQAATSEAIIEKEALKLLDKYICHNSGGLSYIDNFSDELSHSLASTTIPVYNWFYGVMKVKDFANLQDNIAEWLVENNTMITLACSVIGEIKFEKLLTRNESFISLKRECVGYIIKLYKLMDDTLLSKLPDFMIELLSHQDVQNAIFSKPELIKILETLDQNSDPLATKREILSKFMTDDNYALLTEEQLDVLLTVDQTIMKLSEVCSIKNLSYYPASTLKLLLSTSAMNLYSNKLVTFETLVSFDPEEIKVLLEVPQYKFYEICLDSGKQANFEIISKQLCPNHYFHVEDFEIELREQMYDVLGKRLHAQDIDMWCNKYEYEI
jgi:hypothetical protein